MTNLAHLTELVSIVGGGTPKRSRADYYNGPIPWVTPKDMKRWNIRQSQETITKIGLEESASRLIPSGSILIVIRSGVLKHTLPIAIARRPVAINQDMKALIPKAGTDPEYIARFIPWSAPTILQWVRATTADNFPLDELKTLRVSVPPLAVQESAAKILAKADQQRQMHRYALQVCDEFLPAPFLEMFGDPRSNPHGYTVGKLGSLLSQGPALGTTTPCTTTGQYTCVRVGEIGAEEIDYSSCGRVDLSPAELARYSVADGDILLARAIGSADHLGKLSVAKRISSAGPIVHDSHVMKIRTNSDILLPTYLASMLRTAAGRALFMQQARRTAVQFNINSDQIEGLAFPLPPVEQQKQFAVVLARVQKLRAIHLEALRQADHLFETLLHQAIQPSTSALGVGARKSPAGRGAGMHKELVITTM